MNKKIITYLKDENVPMDKINEILNKYHLNPEDKITNEVVSLIENEMVSITKPMKKIKIKKKIVKKVTRTVDISGKVKPREEDVSPTSVHHQQKDKQLEEKALEKLQENFIHNKEKAIERDIQAAKGSKPSYEKKSYPPHKNERYGENRGNAPKTDNRNYDNRPKRHYDNRDNRSEGSQEHRKFEKKVFVPSNSPNRGYDNRGGRPYGNTGGTGQEGHDHRKKIYIKKKNNDSGVKIQKREFKFTGGKGNEKTGSITPETKEISKKFSGKAKKKNDQYIETRRDKESGLDAKLDATMKKRKEENRYNVPTKIEIPDSITVADLAKKMTIKSNVIIKKLFDMGTMVTINQIIDAETAEIIASEFGCEVARVSVMDEIKIPEQQIDKQTIKKRPPIVTVMGHVDHGKTTLLDYIRNTKVAASEAGGITQKIGAYKVDVKGNSIVFIDTPGHAAFTNMRARGAQVTDIVVLVVAADDGVMPQTKEAINHAKEANVPVIVAVNKIDKSNANPDKVKGELGEFNIIPQEWGGDNLFFNVSALKGKGVDELLEGILLLADSIDLNADFNEQKWGEGYILESKIDKGRGIIATVVIKNGCAKVRQFFVAGNEYGKIRIMIDDLGKQKKTAYPGDAIEIIGFEGLPEAGDVFNIVDDEKVVKSISKKRKDLETIEKHKKSGVNLDSILKQIEQSDTKELKVIVNADLNGMVEALTQALEKLSVKEIKVKVIQKSVGAIKESDVNLAIASSAIIIGFNTKPTAKAAELADQESVEIRRYNIIYDAIEDLKNAISGLASPKIREEIVGEVEVRQVFKVPNAGNVAGSYVLKGSVIRNALCRVYRDNVKVFESKIASLFRFKDAVKEVKQGYECGLTVENFNDIREGDVIEVYKNVEQALSFDELEKNQPEEQKNDEGN